MENLYKVDSPIDRERRKNLNDTLEDILRRFSNLQRQINILAGDNDVDELIQRIMNAINSSEATLEDLQTALSDAQQEIVDMLTATTNATNATEAANQAATEATQLIGEMTILQTDLEQLQTSLNQIIIDATQATIAADTATDNANQATNDAHQAKTYADNAASRANNAADAIYGWGSANKWVAGTYNRNNVVTHGGNTYQARKDGVTSTPPINPAIDNSDWIILARKGVDGNGSVSSVNGFTPDPEGNVTVPTNNTVITETDIPIADRESDTFYWIVTDSAHVVPNGNIKASPTMGLKIVEE